MKDAKLVVIVFLLTRAAIAADQIAETAIFRPVIEGSVITHLALTEDGMFLLVAAGDKQLSVLEVPTGRRIAGIDCPVARFFICRGKFVYVATGEGFLNVYSQDAAWKLSGQIKLEDPNVNYISAAAGSRLSTGTSWRHAEKTNESRRLGIVMPPVFGTRLTSRRLSRLRLSPVPGKTSFFRIMSSRALAGFLRFMHMANYCGETPQPFPRVNMEHTGFSTRPARAAAGFQRPA